MKNRKDVLINECPVAAIPTEEEVQEEWKILKQVCKDHKDCFFIANTTLREVMRGFAKFVYYRDTRTFTAFRLDRYDSTPIQYCPYCGKKLPESLDEDWWNCLKMEYGYPEKIDVIPLEFESDAWWKKRHLDDPKVLEEWRKKFS